jgi:hypothetical protein
MSNPLLNVLNSQPKGVANESIVDRFNRFKQTFKGDPQKRIDELLRAGSVTQEQVDQATQIANLIKGYSKR